MHQDRDEEVEEEMALEELLYEQLNQFLREKEADATECSSSKAKMRLCYGPQGELAQILDQEEDPITDDMWEAINAKFRLEEATKEEEEEKQQQTAIDSEDEQESTIHQQDAEPMPMQVLESNGTTASMSSAAIAPTEQVALPDQQQTQRPMEIEVATPQELDAKGISVAQWLGQNPSEQMHPQPPQMSPPPSISLSAALSTNGTVSTTASTPSAAVPQAEPKQLPDPFALPTPWPTALSHRLRVVFHATTFLGHGDCVVYWLRNTPRTKHDNFALQAAFWLAKQLNLPLCVVCFVPNCFQLPLAHARGVDEAYGRRSFLEVHQEFERAQVQFLSCCLLEDHVVSPDDVLGIQPVAAGNPKAKDALRKSRLLAFLKPYVVIADESFHIEMHQEMEFVAEFLKHQPGGRCCRTIACVENETCVPLNQLHCLNQEDKDGYSALLESQLAQWTQEKSMAICCVFHLDRAVALNGKRMVFANDLNEFLTTQGIVQVNWRIVEATLNPIGDLNAPVSYSESAAIAKLENLFAEATMSATTKPAIQQELGGSGILSLMPFVRHGSLFAGLVIARLVERIAELLRTPRNRVNALLRRQLATLKVFRSRAVDHLAKERDLLLLLSHKRICIVRKSADMVPPAAALSMLQTCWQVFPALRGDVKTDNGVVPHGFKTTENGHAPSYLPYELEQMRTRDSEWNKAQFFLLSNGYLHPVLMTDWALKVLQWNEPLTSRYAALTMIEALLIKFSCGSSSSPDVLLGLFHKLFTLEMN